MLSLKVSNTFHSVTEQREKDDEEEDGSSYNGYHL